VALGFKSRGATMSHLDRGCVGQNESSTDGEVGRRNSPVRSIARSHATGVWVSDFALQFLAVPGGGNVVGFDRPVLAEAIGAAQATVAVENGCAWISRGDRVGAVTIHRRSLAPGRMTSAPDPAQPRWRQMPSWNADASPVSILPPLPKIFVSI
jgi:hypothetical protein